MTDPQPQGNFIGGLNRGKEAGSRQPDFTGRLSLPGRPVLMTQPLHRLQLPGHCRRSFHQHHRSTLPCRYRYLRKRQCRQSRRRNLDCHPLPPTRMQRLSLFH